MFSSLSHFDLDCALVYSALGSSVTAAAVVVFFLFYFACYITELRATAVVRTAALQQKGCGLDSGVWTFYVWSLNFL